jgi:hypothetical protein
MNNKILFSVLLLVAFIYKLPNARAQGNAEWQPIFLLVTGGNTVDGVEASFQLNKCGSEDVVSIRFFNHNSYPVVVEWYDAVFTQSLKWVNEERVAQRKSVTLPANSEAKGECSKTIYPKLLVKVKDFVSDKKDFKRYSASQLTVVPVQ